MSTPIAPDPDDTTFAAATDQPTAATAVPAAHPDPITGEPGAHPIGVGVGALSAGAAGAAIGSIGGPIGVLIGAAIGAVAGGLAGKEVATAPEERAADVAAPGEPPLTLPVDAPTPITMGSVPGEGFRASSGSAVLDDEETFTTTGASGWTTVPELAGAGLRAPMVPETTPLAGEVMPHSGEEAVQVAAYYLYVERSAAGRHGDALSDWLDAEREMMLS